jgi:RNA polymerase sigma-70 factor, ECF subfamily
MLTTMARVNPEEQPESVLVDRAKAGDQEAFDRLVSNHIVRVWRVVWRILRRDEDADDVVQEVFLAAYQGLAGYRGESSFSTWIHRIAVTRALNHLDRSSERMRRASSPLEAASGGEDRPAPIEVLQDRSPSPLQALEADELRRRLQKCLSKLPPFLRAAIALRDAESLSYDEIASALGVAIGTVRSRLARARTSLRECIEGRTT